MDSNPWKQVDSLLQSVLEHPPEDREGFLRHASAGDEELEREVRSLLAADQKAGRFLENPAIEVAARTIAFQQDREIPASSGDFAGRTISHFRVVEKLGA